MNITLHLRSFLFAMPLLASFPATLMAVDKISASAIQEGVDIPVLIVAKPSTSAMTTENKQAQDLRAEKKLTSPIYTPPKGMGRPWPTQGGGTRGGTTCNPTLAVLAPKDHTGLTLEEQPSLYWYISESCQHSIELTITEEDAIAPLLEHQLPAPPHPGIQKVNLGNFPIHLKIGKRYQWSIAMVLDPAHRSKDIVAIGGIARVSSSSNQGMQLDQVHSTGTTENFLMAGLWYDALESLSRKIEQAPTQELTDQRTTLLKQVQLDQILFN